jgi:uncharacterized protein YyaL (SSP411 family)
LVHRCPTLLLTTLLASGCGNGLSQSGGVEVGGIVGVLPGASAYTDDLASKLNQAWGRRDPDYKPRTRHLNENGTPKFTNRLFLEGSLYLLQHAHNPMNWYPWGDEAFAEAKRLGRPVLLSVGYSTCHWCHVMEEESFDDIEIARFINENYVAIKVDREERPDVDAIYMSAVQAMGKHGGWPMTAWLTPDRKPFYAGTYFPARDGDRGAEKGFLTILRELREIYDEQPEKVAEFAAEVTSRVETMLEPATGVALPGADVLHEAAKFYGSRFDAEHGGLRGAPKFPSSLSVRFLLRYHRRTGEGQYLDIVEKTLDMMARGGMYDHVGGGFHRYATDAAWQVPHFEKMLYDNALLVLAYLEGYQATGRKDFARTAREILRYIERDMTSPEGAFYSATDADTLNPEGEREEGWFFTWTPAEVEAVLGADSARIVRAYYDITEQGNFEGRNIPNTPKPIADVAGELEMPVEKVRAVVEASREKLYRARLQRPPPLRDEKVLTSWNGLMISAHAVAALVFGQDEYAQKAERAADFILENLRRDGRLLRRYKDGEARHNAYLDDYAFFIAGLLDLYEATGKPRWLRHAIELDQVLAENYEDQDNGGFFMTSDDHEKLLAREKPNYDGAEPSGNSVAVLNLLRLHEFTTRDEYRQRAEKAFRAFQSVMQRSPIALSEMLLALDFYLDTAKEIIIVTPNARDEAAPLLAELRGRLVPNRMLSVVSQGGVGEQVKLVPLLEDKRALGGKPTAYVCERRVCELPTSDPKIFAKQIRKVEPLP